MCRHGGAVYAASRRHAEEIAVDLKDLGVRALLSWRTFGRGRPFLPALPLQLETEAARHATGERVLPPQEPNETAAAQPNGAEVAVLEP